MEAVAIEFDTAKSQTNLKARGFGFEIMEDFIWDYAILADVQIVDFEERELWPGPIANQLFAAVGIELEDAFRVISLRFATNLEIEMWRKEFRNE